MSDKLLPPLHPGQRADGTLELDAEGRVVTPAETRRRGLLEIGRRLLEQRRRDVSMGRLPPELDGLDVEALALATAEEERGV